MSLVIIKILYSFALSLSLFMSTLFILRKSEERPQDIYLAIFLLVISIFLWNSYVIMEGGSLTEFYLDKIGLASGWLIGPCLFLYCSALSDKRRYVIKELFPHFAPALLIYIFLIITHKISIPINRLIVKLILGPLFVQLVVYGYFALKKVINYENLLLQNTANYDSVQLGWMKLLILAYLVTSLTDLTYFLVGFPDNDFGLLPQLMMLFEACCVIGLGGYALKVSQQIQQPLIDLSKDKYKNSTLNQQKANALMDMLETTMTTEKPYLDNEISLSILAEKIGVKPHQLSEMLNQNIGKSFYVYINEARIKEACSMLSSDKFAKLPVIDIAYQVGFNNKNTFNKSFRQLTNMTPTEYRKTESLK